MGVDQSCDSCGDGRPYQSVKYRKHTVAPFFLMRQLLAPDPETIIVVTMLAIRLGEDAVAEIGLRAAERRRLLDAIEKQLAHEPAEGSRRKKTLSGLVPPWEQVCGQSGSFGSVTSAFSTTWMNRAGS